MQIKVKALEHREKKLNTSPQASSTVS